MSRPAAQSLRRALQRQGLRSFEIAPTSVEVLATPCDFYESLLTACRGARSRISLSALYWGTGALEQDLAAAVEGAMAARDAKVTVVLDAARARRADGAGRTSVSTPLPRTAARRGSSRRRASAVRRCSARWTARRGPAGLVNEILGVHHVKVFAVDDRRALGSAGLDLESKALAAVLEPRGFDALGLATAYVNPPEDVAAALAASDAPVDWAGPGTFHGKGVWLFEEGRGAATVLGSSNFNARSRDRDLELGAVLLPATRASAARSPRSGARSPRTRAPDAAAPPWWLGPPGAPAPLLTFFAVVAS
ncbi:CDP-diacylglycerol-glycerol-3-phosphate 3-phosphatidyltransferase [Aureococcus anophagefferens]|nr:CDP-diacylglycerol-glycerol-3-phosphate 3-phosphatidyltransferase [Aureococcus anophagefferens]